MSGNRLEPKVVRTWILSGAGLQGNPREWAHLTVLRERPPSPQEWCSAQG